LTPIRGLRIAVIDYGAITDEMVRSLEMRGQLDALACILVRTGRRKTLCPFGPAEFRAMRHRVQAPRKQLRHESVRDYVTVMSRIIPKELVFKEQSIEDLSDGELVELLFALIEVLSTVVCSSSGS